MHKLLFLILQLYMVSCSHGYKVLINGRYSHKESQRLPGFAPHDSTVVLGEYDKVPDSAAFVTRTTVRAQPPGFFSHYWGGSALFTLTNIARLEAQKSGANLIKILGFGPLVYSDNGANIIVETYCLKEPFLAAYRKKLDSLDAVTCRVHIKYYQGYLDNRLICFNDSLVGSLRDEYYYDKPGIGLCLQRYDFRFANSGMLALKDSLKATDKNGIRLEKGGVYYIAVTRGKTSPVGVLRALDNSRDY